MTLYLSQPAPSTEYSVPRSAITHDSVGGLQYAPNMRSKMVAGQSPLTAGVTLDVLETLVDRLRDADQVDTDAERIDLITALERLKGAAAAAQARLTAAFADSQRAAGGGRSRRAEEKLGSSIAHQIALARRDSPQRGHRHVGFARALVDEMPHTLEALTDGAISEWRATILVRETAVLSAEHRRQVDAELAGRLAKLGDRGVETEAKKIAYRLDPESVVRRARRAEGDRRVTIRPAPDTMSYVTGLLPVAQGVAVRAALRKHADTLRAAGDPRTRGQIMADTFVERLTGQAKATGVPVAIELIMTDRTLFGGGREPARIVGHGPIPAALARALVRGGPDLDEARVWIRRLYTHPITGALTAMESRQRVFPAPLRKFLVIRDDVCRTPWCDAPIRHADHVQPVADGGETSAQNGQGLCEACNQAKEATGWSHTATSERAGPITIRTPTGHTYTSWPPDLPGHRARPAARAAPARGPSPLEARLRRLVESA